MKLFQKNESKETVKLPMSGKVKKGFRFYCVTVIGELVFNMLVLVGAVKMADRVVREMMGL